MASTKHPRQWTREGAGGGRGWGEKGAGQGPGSVA